MNSEWAELSKRWSKECSEPYVCRWDKAPDIGKVDLSLIGFIDHLGLRRVREKRAGVVPNNNPFKLFKIGISKNPAKRCRQIELASGYPVQIVKCWQTLDVPAFEVEQFLHRQFSRKRKHGEWFENITVPDVEYAGYDLVECNHDGSTRRWT